MAHTFDIRFARSSGIAALLATPANSFRWRGAGSLSIDSTGLEIEPRPGLHSLLARRARLRINAADLREVSRVGDDLRIEFGMPGSRRAAVPFWVRDRQTADEIMRLVPTRRTIEREPTDAHELPRRSRAWLVAAVMLAVSGAAFVVVSRNPASSPVAEAQGEDQATANASPVIADPASAPVAVTLAMPVSAARVESPREKLAPRLYWSPRSAEDEATSAVEVAVDTTPVPDAAPLPMAEPSPTGDLVAFVPGERLYDRARRQFDAFQEQAASSYVQYFDGTPPEDIAASWTQFSQRVASSADFTEPKLRPMIDDELAAAASWRAALLAYGEAARARDAARLERARADLQRASEATARIALHVAQP